MKCFLRGEFNKVGWVLKNKKCVLLSTLSGPKDADRFLRPVCRFKPDSVGRFVGVWLFINLVQYLSSKLNATPSPNLSHQLKGTPLAQAKAQAGRELCHPQSSLPPDKGSWSLPTPGLHTIQRQGFNSLSDWHISNLSFHYLFDENIKELLCALMSARQAVWCNCEPAWRSFPILHKSFQFQYGAIVSGFLRCNIRLNLLFQFQYGAIVRRTCQGVILRALRISIPVWCNCEMPFLNNGWTLNNISIPVWCNCEHIFQYHRRMVKPFQFQYGAIVSSSYSVRTIPNKFISIPVWCNCERVLLYNQTVISIISIPVWCNCEGFS